MQQTVFITGATSGFGKACALKFAQNNYRLIITGRRNERLSQLAEQLKADYDTDVLTLNFDVRKRKDVEFYINSMPAEWHCIDLLINNAGLALGRDNFADANIADWETMIDTNLKGLTYVTKALLPFFIKVQKGHIINVGSTAAKDVYAEGNMYCATKHAVQALSEAMRIDLLKYNIKVTAIHPGAAETEFSNVRFKGNAELAAKVYEGITPLTAEDVAAVIYFSATLPPHVCINDLILTCTQQANSFYTFKKG